jgi:hypothetical protein
MSKKMLFSITSVRDDIQVGNIPFQQRNLHIPRFDHIDNLFSEVETVSHPNNIRNGDRHIRNKKDNRVIGNVHTILPSFEMDFIEESPLCISSDPLKPNVIATIWNCQKEVQALREKKKSKYFKLIND